MYGFFLSASHDMIMIGTVLQNFYHSKEGSADEKDFDRR
ncbi:MAG: hypothetical protein BSOLF_1954 [Candidatus Carbobacillus altaicus]|uniref:Uncharacterized protein n=1 Tax=Candidatus Carbonibacillus altaicus TaxID=2163959 RepID=A0A2R6XYK0_9BACL|nr:MAG: hypothetical protein BSOLF_1954 [Candidatus Carbobacillus altaicus]